MRTIFHIDVNSAFLSWSAVKQLRLKPDKPDLRTLPAIVCASTDRRHGIVTAKSIPAKAFGIKTGEPIALALQKCPKLLIVRSDFEVYREYSRQFMTVLRSFCNRVEQASIDEAYLDMTETMTQLAEIAGQDHIDPLNIAYDIKNCIKNKLGFTVNIGISTNKLLAKMASDFEKPDKIHTLYPNEIDTKLWPLPVQDLYGCGEKTSAKLRQYGIMTIGEIVKSSLDKLQRILGRKLGEYIFLSAQGINDSPVNPIPDARKSYSCELTTEVDITTENYFEYVPKILDELTQQLTRRLTRDRIFGQTLVIIVTTSDFKRHSRQKVVCATNNRLEIFQSAKYLFDEFLIGKKKDGFLYQIKGIRLLGIGMTNLTDVCIRQGSLLDYIGN